MQELKQSFIKRLEMMWSVEDQLVTAIPTLIENATNEDLCEALRAHLEETKMHRSRIEQVFTGIGHNPSHEKNEPFAEMLATTEVMLAEAPDADLRDLIIIAEAGNVEHLEISNYTTLVAWAQKLEYDDAIDHLKKTLSEEDGASGKLNKLAEGNFFKSGILDHMEEPAYAV